MHLVDNIDIQNGLLGGVILGVSSSMFMLLTGKVTGLSGIAEGVVSIKGENWNVSYIAGLCSAGAVLAIYKPEAFGSASSLSTATLLAAGLITGFGTRLSGGCTSGHGLCGLSRRSPRSLAAVLTFMTTGAITAYFTRLPQYAELLSAHAEEPSIPLVPAVAAAVGGLYILKNFSGVCNKLSCLFSTSGDKTCSVEISESAMHLTSFASSFLFGIGLGVSGMCNPARVLRFLDFSGSEGWDPTLASVLGGGVAVTFLAFHYFKKTNPPVLLCKDKTKKVGSALNMGLVAPNLKMDWRLLLGSAMFGVGWGLAGMCPGPAMVVAAGGSTAALKFVASMATGMVAKEILLG